MLMVTSKLQQLLLKRKEIARRLQEIKAQGDLSENAAYAQALEELAILDNELIRLKAKQNNLDHPLVGMVIDLLNLETKKAERYEIVSQGVNPLENRISPQSPIAQALKETKEGEEITIRLGSQATRYRLLKIQKSINRAHP